MERTSLKWMFNTKNSETISRLELMTWWTFPPFPPFPSPVWSSLFCHFRVASLPFFSFVPRSRLTDIVVALYFDIHVTDADIIYSRARVCVLVSYLLIWCSWWRWGVVGRANIHITHSTALRQVNHNKSYIFFKVNVLREFISRLIARLLNGWRGEVTEASVSVEWRSQANLLHLDVWRVMARDWLVRGM